VHAAAYCQPRDANQRCQFSEFQSHYFPSGLPRKTGPSLTAYYERIYKRMPQRPTFLCRDVVCLAIPQSQRCQFSEFPVQSPRPTPTLFYETAGRFFVRPNILLSTLFSNTHSLCSSLNVSDQVSHPYRTNSKIILLYILIFKFLDSKLEDKRFCTE